MKIAIWHNLPSGGGKRALYYHVKGLVERGHEVVSWCPDTADQTYLPLGELIEERIIPLSRVHRDPKNLKNRVLRPYHDITDRLSAMHRHCQQAADQMNEMGFDVLFAQPCTWFRSSPIARYAKIPSLLFLHEPYRWLYEALPQLPWVAPEKGPRDRSAKSLAAFAKDFIQTYAYRIQMREEIAFARDFDRILANSQYSRECILKAYGMESTVCLLGVDTDLFQAPKARKKPFVLSMGVIYDGKGVDRAIRAVAAIPKDSRPELVWIGNGAWPEYAEKMTALARSLDVQFVPKVRIPDAEVVELLSTAAVMIYTPRLEPFGFAPIEANACGTTVVGIAEAGVRETIQDGINGFLVNDDDPKALAALLMPFLSDLQLARDAGLKARSHVLGKWGFDESIDRIERLLFREIGAPLPSRLEPGDRALKVPSRAPRPQPSTLPN